MELFQVKKKSLLKTQPEIIDWIEESISDIEYLIEMQKLEDDEYLQSNKNPHIVPISGLVYFVFFRYINEHKTVLDCWQQEDTASQVLSPNSNEFLSHSHSKLSLQSSISYLHYLILQNQTEPCNFINKFGETPLHIACLAGCVKIVKLFLEFGANIHTVTKNKSESALHYAVRSGSCEVVALLLNYAAEPAQSSASGDSPIDLAIKLKMTSIIDCFKSSAVGLNEKSINKKR